MNELQLAQLLGINQPSPIHPLCPNWQGIENINLLVKRDDLLHPIISGNKWRKLKFALLQAVQQQTQHIISFGGGFSNHLHALGYCCHKLNIQFTAIVRGDYSSNLSPMLQDLVKWKTNIQYVDRQTYQERNSPAYLSQLIKHSPKACIIPEGGSQQAALKGVGEILQEITQPIDYLILPVGSGGTLAGLVANTNNPMYQLIGIGVLKGQDYLESLVQALLPNPHTTTAQWHIEHDYHFGGYGKSPEPLKQFCSDFTQNTQVPIEPVYSGKMFFAIQALIANQNFAPGSTVLALHTGGLQGAR
ncbi:1-aminocyclopropane-1-carboxylate deaminase/D-cysteine desulfhydrase [Paraglaciecola aestuariivivens]